MGLDSLSAAKRMCERSNWSMTNLTLHKILYIAHMYYLGLKSEPLVKGHFQAWIYGPVHPEIYHYVKVFGASPIGNIFRSIKDPPEGDLTDVLDQAVDQLSNTKPGTLIALTHREYGAWAKYYRSSIRNAIIPNEDIKNEYEEFQRRKKLQA